MTEVPIVYSPLGSFIDRDDQDDLELACLSNMSVTIIMFPNIKIHPVLLSFISDLFALEKDDIDEKKYKHPMIAVHGPSIIANLHLVQLLSYGYINFIQVYVLNGFIFASEFDENKNLICHMSQTHFSTVEPLETFFHNLGVLFVSFLRVGEVHPEPMHSLFRRPVKELFAEYMLATPLHLPLPG
jgi:hypothetical protein